MGTCQIRNRRYQALQIAVDELERVAYLHHERGVHDVLTRGTPMDEFAMGFAGEPDQLLDQIHDRQTSAQSARGQFVKIEQFSTCSGGDRSSSLGRNHTELPLNLGQRDLDQEHGLQ